MLFVYTNPKISITLFLYLIVCAVTFDYFRNFTNPYIHLFLITVFTLIQMIIIFLKINKKTFSIYIILNIIFITYILLNNHLLDYYFKFFHNPAEFFSEDARSWKFLDLSFFYNFFISLYSLNPINKLYYYANNDLVFQYVFLFFPSLISIVLMLQVLLSFIFKKFKFEYDKQLSVGLFLVISAYALGNIPMDSRIFICILSPFFIYIHKQMLSPKFLIGLTLILSMPSVIKLILLYNNLIQTF